MSALTPDDVVLGLLAIAPQHGYELLARFNQPQHLGRVWTLSTSQLYKVLKRLEGDGLLIGQVLEGQNAPKRIAYHLTSAGDVAWRAWLHDEQPSASVRRVRVEFLSRLYIALQLGIATSGLIHAQRAACLRQLQHLHAEQAQAAEGMEALTIGLHSAQLDAIVRWIDHIAAKPLFDKTGDSS